MTAPGPLPDNIHCARDYEVLAAERLDAPTLAHLQDGAGDGAARRANLAALARVTLLPRILRDLTSGETTCRLAGAERPHPIWLAPVASQGLFHPGAERETARGADAASACMVVSTLSSLPLETIAAGAVAERWFQLYVQPDRAATLDLVQRAQTAGYGAIMLTVDAPVQTPGRAALRAGFAGIQPAANLARHDSTVAGVAPGASRIFGGPMRHAPTWSDIAWIKAQTTLPIWLKGVMHPGDARAAFDAGVAGIVVSNHGGRTLEAAAASLSALPAVRAAVGPLAPVLFDGGIRSGEDVFRAIALGADGVMVGRLQACALAVGGALGVAHMIRLLREELEVCMALAGCASLSDIARADVGDPRC